MAYLSPDYEYDIFVSYSHGDPKQTGTSPLKIWSHSFIEALKADFYALADDFDNVEIWYDKDIDPTLELTPELRSKVKASAILMIMMSPKYLKSAWCGDECAWFEEQIRDRAVGKGRFFVVRVVPTKDSSWPAFLRDERGHPIVGFRFHPPPDQPEDSVTPFGWPDLTEHNESFRRELNRLRMWLVRRLRELKQDCRIVASKPAPMLAEAGRLPRIYLHARPEHVDQREAIDRTLSECGSCLVIAPSPNAMDRDLAHWAQESKSRIAIARYCDVLALLRPSPDHAFLGDFFSVGVDERWRIEAERSAPLPCIVLDGSGTPLEIDAARYGIDRLEISEPGWLTAFLTWIQKKRAVQLETS